MRTYEAHLSEPGQQVERSTGSTTRMRRGDRERTSELFFGLHEAGPAERSAIRAEVVSLHLWLATSAARRFWASGELDDLVQVARLGLVEAFDRFDPEQGSYANFAWLTMTGLLRRHLRDHGWSVRPPRALQESANVLRAAIPGLTQELRRTPTTTDLAEHLEWSTPAVRDATRANQGLRATSLSTLVGEGWVPAQASEDDGVETRVLVGRALQTLSDDERDLIRLRFVEERTQVEIGAALHTTQMGVSRRLNRLMLKLRSTIGELDSMVEGPTTPSTRAPGASPAVAQAKGIVMGCHGCDPAAALMILERSASRTARTLVVVAAEVVAAFSGAVDTTAGRELPAHERLRRALHGAELAADRLARDHT